MWRSRRPGGLIGTAALALVLFLASLPASSQVVIRENVDLSEPSATAEAPESLGGGGHTVSFVALRDGFLFLNYQTIFRRGGEYPSGQPTLEVYNDGVLVGVDDILSHSGLNPIPLYIDCDGVQTPYTWYSGGARVPLPIPIVTGETISFLFQTDMGTYGDDPDEGTSTYNPELELWFTILSRFEEPCPIWPPIERLQLSAYVRDPSVEFIRQTDNQTIADRLRISTNQTDLDLPASSAVGDSGSDPDTYRLEARGLPGGQAITFEVETTESGGGPTNTYTYQALQGTDPGSGDVVYRSEQFFRLVSNGIPTVGPDPAAVYDDEYAAPGAAEDPTLLVKLDATVRGAFSDILGERASKTLPVGVPGMPPDPPTDDTILTGGLVFTGIRDRDFKPRINAPLATERASEDWAQARIQFEVEATNANVRPVENLIQVSGTATSDGQVRIKGRSRCCGAPIIFDVTVPIATGDVDDEIADNIATAINASGPNWAATAHGHKVPSSPTEDYELVLIDAVGSVGPDNVTIVNIVLTAPGVDIIPPTLNFRPLDFSTAGRLEEHSIALNYEDDDLTNIDVFVVPKDVLGGNALGTGWGYLWRLLMEGIENTVFVDTRAVDNSDRVMPFTFGHELGHVLLNQLFVGSDGAGHSPDAWNLMKASTSTVEMWDASKRLNAVQIDDARMDSGPGATNPVILKDN